MNVVEIQTSARRVGAETKENDSNMNRQSETVTFYLNCAEPQVYLVGQKQGQKSLVIEMRQFRPGIWFASVELNEGKYRFRYYAGDGRNVLYLGPAHTGGSSESGLDAVVSIREGSIDPSLPRN
jgi:hypothetical protein